jgi:uncharacterized protein YjiS (DUF1127 family)
MNHAINIRLEINADLTGRQHGQWLRALLAWWKKCRARTRERHALARLDDRLLSDIGISRCDAEREIEKPFWR